MGIDATVRRGIERMQRGGIQPIPFVVPPNNTGMQGCSGNKEADNCPKCPRLLLAGPQLHPRTTRGADGRWSCVNEVGGCGAHVTSVQLVPAGAQSAKCGGEFVTTPAHEGAPS